MNVLCLRDLSIVVLLLPVALAGCSGGESVAPAAAGQSAVETPALGDPAPAPDAAMIAAANGKQISLSPENTLIQFVGVHVDPAKPDPRTGKFNKFNGKITALDNQIKSISADIDTASLSTDIELLTNHLKGTDFFNVNEHPVAKFASTRIEPAGDGRLKVTGDLTLLGKTQSISFPATVSFAEPFSLQADFKIDRTQFGMDYGTDRVLKDVEMTIAVKEAPAPAASDAATAAAAGRQVTLSPENTLVQFVGTHADPKKPAPRTGKFNKFTGTITHVNADVKSIKVDIDTASLSTEIDKLTNHLKSADFFNVNEHPKATFTSTKIEPAGDGKVNITGDLTLLGKTQSISFPATISTDDKFSLKAAFKIDRTRFGMDYGTDSVLKEVDMSITVNE
jgi:polyisoprenoid-binding protein YceI